MATITVHSKFSVLFHHGILLIQLRGGGIRGALNLCAVRYFCVVPSHFCVLAWNSFQVHPARTPVDVTQGYVARCTAL